MECVMVIESNGVYQIHPNAVPEDWDMVRGIAESVKRIESLTGWGRWTAAYRVQWAKGPVWIPQFYFVQESVK